MSNGHISKPDAYLNRLSRLAPLHIRDYYLDPATRRLTAGAVAWRLTPLQVLLADALLTGRGTHEELWEKVWGYPVLDEAGRNTLQVNLHYFRRLVGPRLQRRWVPQRQRKEWLLV